MEGHRRVQSRGERRRAFSVRLLVVGMLLFPLSIAIAGAAGNTPHVLGYLGPAILAALVAVLVVVTGRLFVPTLVVALLMLLLFGLFGIGDLAHPESFADFAPALWRTVGLATAVVAAAIATRQRRSGTLRRATRRERRTVGIGALALIAVTVGAFVFESASRTTIARADGAVVVNTLEDSFDPETIGVRPGRQRFLIRNDDAYAHTFTIDDLAVDEYVAPRRDRFVTVTFPRNGRFVLSCAVTGHEDMTGRIVVG
jgi:plastocyanin